MLNTSSPEAAVISQVNSPKEAATPLSEVPGPSTKTSVHIDKIPTRLRRLEYLRCGIGADCEVHVPKLTATASEKLEQDVMNNKNWNGVLQINGVSPESVEIFLEFVYTFDIQTSRIDLRLISDIFILSGAYNLPELFRQFTQKLQNVSWPLEGIFPTYNLAFRHNLHDLEYSCIPRIIERAAELKSDPGIMMLKTYAFTNVIYYWLATKALSIDEIIQVLQQYQKAKNLTFKNSKHFPHFIKIIKYFPTVLLDSEGLIHKY